MSPRRLDQKFYVAIPYSFILHDPDYGDLKPTARAAFIKILAYMASLYPDATNGQTIINATTMKMLTGCSRIDRAEDLMREIEATGLLLLHGQGEDKGGLKCPSGAQNVTGTSIKGVHKWFLAVKNLNEISGPKVQKVPSYSLNQLNSEKTLKRDVKEEEEEARKVTRVAPGRDPQTCDLDQDPYAEKRSQAHRRGNSSGGLRRIRAGDR